jgi:nondiscriminating glutamyl-tRNA synthetase
MVFDLLQRGLAYNVYAYPEDIEALHDKMLSEGKAPHYSQEMLEVFNSPERVSEFEAKGLNPVVFFNMPRKEYRLPDKNQRRGRFQRGSNWRLCDNAVQRSTNI